LEGNRGIYYVRRLLGRKEIENTEIYIMLEKAIFGEKRGKRIPRWGWQTVEEIKSFIRGWIRICM